MAGRLETYQFVFKSCCSSRVEQKVLPYFQAWINFEQAYQQAKPQKDVLFPRERSQNSFVSSSLGLDHFQIFR